MFKVGDKVVDVLRGKGMVFKIKNERHYPITVRFGKCVRHYTYTLDGMYNTDHIYPSLFHDNNYKSPSCDEPKRLPELKVDTKVLVKSQFITDYERRYFSHFDENGNLCCFMQGCDSWSSKDRKTTKWEKWKLADD
jgi:hypothetical protein